VLLLCADNMAWDMDDMSSVMMIPVVFCLHIVLICLGTFTGKAHHTSLPGFPACFSNSAGSAGSA
jgi:hypothetical protein